MTDAFQSRWGYHPCSYEFFLKLKRLHKWYWQTVYDFHRWHRWQRKDPVNRRGPEPAFCEAFVEDTPWFKPVTRRGECHVKIYPKAVVDHGIVELYHAARHPQPEPPTPFDDATHERIEALLAEATPHFA